jgi:glycosyltransferase involved in cell wall biosynthesis
MRIAVAHESVSTEGGVETYLQSIITALRHRGHQVALVYHRRCPRSTPLRASAHVAIGIEERGMEAAFSELAAWKPDVVFSHNMGPLDVDRQLLDRWPVVKMLHGYFGTCVSGLKMHAFPSACACDRTFGAACLALYVPRRCGKLSARAIVQGYRWARAQRALFDRYARTIVASQHMRGEMLRNGVPAARLDVLPLFSTVASSSVAPAGERDTVLFAGRMTTLKGGHVLVGAAARAAAILGRPVNLIMAGDGPQKESWRGRAAALGVRAEFTGWVAAEDRPRVYARAMVAAMPSLWPEPFGLTGLDAASLGRPAVAFDVGGIREWLDDGVNGLLVAPATGETGLARAMASMLEQPAECTRMGEQALATSLRFSLAHHVERLEGALQRAAA